MRILGENKVIPDDEVVFYDGFLWVITENMIKIGNTKLEKVECHKICLCAEYDEPITLADITETFPTVHKVIFDDALRGYVYNYKNHRVEDNNEAWEQVGTTLGYA